VLLPRPGRIPRTPNPITEREDGEDGHLSWEDDDVTGVRGECWRINGLRADQGGWGGWGG